MPLARNRIDPSDLSKLPSPPAVVLELLEAFGDEDIAFSRLAAICAQDAALTARMLAVANSAAFRRRAPPFTSLDRVLVTMGLDMVKTIAVTTSLMQAFAQQESDPTDEVSGFWRHALVCANLARRLAQTTGYPHPDEAYLSGLLHDIGKLLITSQCGAGYAQVRATAVTPEAFLTQERALFATDHCQVGAALMAAWRLRSFLADTARYHHESATLLRDAHPLVRLVHVANALDSDHWDEDRAFAAGDTLFGLTPALLRKLRDEARALVGELSGPLGIGPPEVDPAPSQSVRSTSQTRLLGEMRDRTLVDGLREHLDASEDEPSLLEAVARCVTILFSVDRTRFFVPAGGGRLRGLDPLYPDDPFSQLDCAADGDTLVGRAFASGSTTHAIADAPDLPIFDRQVVGDGGGLLCLPLVVSGRCQAVAVLQTTAEQLTRLLVQPRLLSLFAIEVGRALGALRQRLSARRHEEADRRLLEQSHLHQVLHEVNNPLSIVQNYLDLLALRLSDDTNAANDLQALREEVERVGNILVRLVDDDPPGAEPETGEDPVRLVRRLTGVLDLALCRPRGIQLDVCCDASVPPVAMDGDSLKQVLMNLVRNATEAVADGGRVIVSLQPAVNVDGRSYVELSVSDDGPGIAPSVIGQLFQPLQSTKPGHSGVGLTIVRNLVGAAGGMVSYRSRSGRGSRFQVLLPPFEIRESRSLG